MLYEEEPHPRPKRGRDSSSEQWLEAGDGRGSGARLDGESGPAADAGRCDVWVLGAWTPDCEPTESRFR